MLAAIRPVDPFWCRWCHADGSVLAESHVTTPAAVVDNSAGRLRVRAADLGGGLPSAVTLPVRGEIAAGRQPATTGSTGHLPADHAAPGCPWPPTPWVPR